MEPSAQILAFLNRYERYYLIGHIEPDGDCLGSSLGLGWFLQSRGKEVRFFNEGPFVRTEIQRYVPFFETDPAQFDFPDDGNAAVVILDCSTQERVGSFAEVLPESPIAVIDHHSSTERFGDVRYVDAEAASTSVLIQRIIEASEGEISRDVAEVLLFGLATDTGFFRHLDHGTADTFRASARLIEAGASPKEIFDMIYGGKTMASRKLNARLLERAESVGSSVITWETLADTREFGRENRDSDTLYQLLLGTQSCRIVALLREESENSCSGSLRSTDDTDVGEIARQFGGGGHKRAAGFLAERPWRSVREELIRLFESLNQEKNIVDG